MYIALQKRKTPRILLSKTLDRMLTRLAEEGIPASIIHEDDSTRIVKHVREYFPKRSA